jgi:hypothetical protein
MHVNLVKISRQQAFKSLFVKKEKDYTPEQKQVLEDLKKSLESENKSWVKYFDSKGYNIKIEPKDGKLKINAVPKNKEISYLESFNMGSYSTVNDIDLKLTRSCLETDKKIKKNQFIDRCFHWIKIAIILISIYGCVTGVKKMREAFKQLNNVNMEQVFAPKDKAIQDTIQFSKKIK